MVEWWAAMLRARFAFVGVLSVLTVVVSGQNNAPRVTNDDVAKMIQARLPEDSILGVIRNGTPQFDLTAEKLNQLKSLGATDAILNAMRAASESTIRGQTSSIGAAQVSMPAGTDKTGSANSDILRLIKAGVPESTIILAIQSGSVKFDSSPDGLIELKTQGASEPVLAAVLSARRNSDEAAGTGHVPANASEPATIYIYRRKALMDSPTNPMVLCDKAELARLEKGYILQLRLEAGDHSCTLTGGGILTSHAETNLYIDPGKTVLSPIRR